MTKNLIQKAASEISKSGVAVVEIEKIRAFYDIGGVGKNIRSDLAESIKFESMVNGSIRCLNNGKFLVFEHVFP